MSNIIELLPLQEFFTSSNPATQTQISDAEATLDLKFAGEYVEYLISFGCVSIYGHEFTGICSNPSLNVVNVTTEQKTLHNKIPENMYVIEELHIDGIVIWQNAKGEIFQTLPFSKPQKICNSFAEYLDL